MTYVPVSPPAYLSERLTITLWDFPWYVPTTIVFFAFQRHFVSGLRVGANK